VGGTDKLPQLVSEGLCPPRVGRAAKAMITPIRIAIAMMIAWTSRCREYLRKVARMAHPLPSSIRHRGGLRQEKVYGLRTECPEVLVIGVWLRIISNLYSLRRLPKESPIDRLGVSKTHRSEAI
jgi:hypothetical protein